MKLISILLVLFIAASDKPAPTTKPAPAAAAPVATPATAAVPTPPPVPEKGLTLDSYINELAKALKLSDSDKKMIEDYYVTDGVQMNNILNSADTSPFQKEQQISGLRDARNEKIKTVLHNPALEQTFFQIEAKYRVALTELAADKGLIAAPPPTAPAK